jgi:hypothetical protein
MLYEVGFEVECSRAGQLNGRCLPRDRPSDVMGCKFPSQLDTRHSFILVLLVGYPVSVTLPFPRPPTYLSLLGAFLFKYFPEVTS